MKHACHRKTRKMGFTLIQLSIALVIIGLIVGGILMGKDLIDAAKLRSIATEKERFTTAAITFRLKYGQIPGDITNATQFWPADTNCPDTALNSVPKVNTCNGNGDGRINPYLMPGLSHTHRYEARRFWQHLANANLIDGSYTGVAGPGDSFQSTLTLNAPASKYGGKTGWGIYSFWGTGNGTNGYAGKSYASNYFIFGTERTNFQPNAVALTGPQTKSIDEKFDDGKPGSGKLLGGNSTCRSNQVSATAEYITTDNTIRCSLVWETGF